MNKSSSASGPRSGFLLFLLLLVLGIGFIFFNSFLPGQVLYSNDAPLGLLCTKSYAAVTASFGSLWVDLNWLGNEGVSGDPNFTTLVSFLLSPMQNAKFGAPIAQLALGLCAFFCFRQLRLAPVACVAGGIAAALNSDFLSTACWGIIAQPACAGAMYLAIAALARVNGPSRWRSWVRVILAGLGVGMGVVQGWDVGALFSLAVAAFVLYQALFLSETSGDTAKKFAWGVVRVAMVAGFAAFIAAHVISNLVGTQIKGVVGMAQTAEAREARWQGATMWSLPPVEVLQIAVPGYFGYRQHWHMYEYEQPKEDQYWGLIGDSGQPGGRRLSGTGLYAGVFVVLVAFWAAFQSFRRRGSPFTTSQRRAIWFWSLVLLATTLLAFGRYVPIFYRMFYALPYAPTIRNPTKFMHVFSWAIVIVFAYGMHGLFTAYMQNSVTRAGGLVAQFKSWWAKAAVFDRRWLTGCLCLLALALLLLLLRAAGSEHFQAYLQSADIPADQTAGVARFNLYALACFVLLLAVSIGLFALIFSGQFSGPRAKWGGALVALFILADLAHADRPWLVYFEKDYMYASDPVVDFLSDKPYEHRVDMVPLGSQSPQFATLNSVFHTAWKQGLFWYHDVQSTVIVQEPRVGQDKEDFLKGIRYGTPAGYLRLWELSNTRYLLGEAGIANYFNSTQPDKKDEWDPVKKRFRIAQLPDGRPLTFALAPKREKTDYAAADFVTQLNTNGPLALIEFTGALPRASLFASWQVQTNDDDTLHTLASTNFDPHETVMVSEPIPAPSAATASQPAGTVTIKPNYEPRRVELEADVKTPSVLLLCDRYNPKWEVLVDGKPDKLLRCNFIERGVLLQPGKHDVVFRFTGTWNGLYVTVAAIALGVGLCGLLVFTKEPEEINAPAAPTGGPDRSPKSTTPVEKPAAPSQSAPPSAKRKPNKR